MVYKFVVKIVWKSNAAIWSMFPGISRVSADLWPETAHTLGDNLGVNMPKKIPGSYESLSFKGLRHYWQFVFRSANIFVSE